MEVAYWRLLGYVVAPSNFGKANRGWLLEMANGQ